MGGVLTRSRERHTKTHEFRLFGISQMGGGYEVGVMRETKDTKRLKETHYLLRSIGVMAVGEYRMQVVHVARLAFRLAYDVMP